MVRQSHKARRGGAIVHEAALAMVLAAAILTSVVQVMALAAQESRSMHQRLTAMHEAGNLMEQLMARSWEQLSPEADTEVALSDSCRTVLPNPKLDIAIDFPETTPEPSAKRLSIRIVWQTESGTPQAPVQLVAWKYPPRKENDQ